MIKSIEKLIAKGAINPSCGELQEQDIEWAYRNILFRNPESSEVIKWHINNSKTIKQLVENITSSDEHKKKHLCRGNQEIISKDHSYTISNEERVEMTSSCRDSESIPKVPNAGGITEIDGMRVQIMHEGSKVVAGGYYGDWMSRIIENLRGHHEPQEELIFHHILGHVRPETLMVELGSFWAYYSNWYLGAVPGSAAVCVEPDENNLECGRRNLALNGREAILINACIGKEYLPTLEIRRESDQTTVNVPCHNMDSLLQVIGDRPIELLHIDAQGAELHFLSSVQHAVQRGLIRFVVVSTHHESISGSSSTHQDCLWEILAMGGAILAEHSVEQSYSGDGLIAASFMRCDRGLCLPKLSINKAEKSLFGPSAASYRYKIVQANIGPMVVSDEDQVISKSLFEQHRFEEDKIFEVIGFLSEKFEFQPEKFVDIGANIGTHIISALNSGRFSSGIAIEMEESNFSLLQANVALNRLSDKTKMIRAALSDIETVACIELSDNNFGDHRIRTSNFSENGKYNEQSRLIKEIRTTTLDNLLVSEGLTLGAGTLVWMDIQGHEGHALAGGHATFLAKESAVPYIVTEMWPYGLERAGGCDNFFRFLETCHAIYDIRTEGWTTLAPISLAEVRSLYKKMMRLPDSKKDHTDLLCIPRSLK